MRFGLTLALVAVLAIFPACAKKSTTIGSTTVSSSSGNVTMTQSNGNKDVSIQTKEGKVVLGQNAVDPNTLGLPVYPGAIPSEGGSLAATTKEGTAKVVTLQTKDSFDKVYAFYKAKMPAGTETSHMSAGGTSMAGFTIGSSTDKEHKTVSIAASGDKVNITLVVGTKP